MSPWEALPNSVNQFWKFRFHWSKQNLPEILRSNDSEKSLACFSRHEIKETDQGTVNQGYLWQFMILLSLSQLPELISPFSLTGAALNCSNNHSLGGFQVSFDRRVRLSFCLARMSGRLSFWCWVFWLWGCTTLHNPEDDSFPPAYTGLKGDWDRLPDINSFVQSLCQNLKVLGPIEGSKRPLGQAHKTHIERGQVSNIALTFRGPQDFSVLCMF